jgi:putative ABC transport system substrate-binding protein
LIAWLASRVFRDARFEAMRRRDFIAGLIGASAALPLAARAQQPGRLPTIGLLGTGTRSTQALRVAVFVQRLRELGWIENQTLTIEYRWAEGRSERYGEIAAEFAQLKVDVIVTPSTPGAMAAKQATASIPIVFVTVTDPVGSGLVASLARPGGNVTGLSIQSPDVAGKRLALLREIAPNLRRVAFMGNIDNPFVRRELHEVQAASSTLGLEAATSEIRHPQDIAAAFEALKHRADAVYLASETLTDTNRLRINILAVGARLPTIWAEREAAEAGGLMSYGPSFPDQYRRAAELVDKILRGAKPANIPVEQPVRFILVINLIVAKALGLEVPPMLLARADEVIE